MPESTTGAGLAYHAERPGDGGVTVPYAIA